MFVPHPDLLRIGEVEAKSHIPVKTIRYYEDLGLIHAAQRTDGGFRLFSSAVLSRLAFIKRAQSLGFSLREIGQILAIHDQGLMPCDTVRQKIQAKVNDIDRRIEQLNTLKTDLLALIAEPVAIAQPSEDMICPILQSCGESPIIESEDWMK